VEPAGVIELRPVDRSNWRDCARLRLGPGQDDLVASKVWSIAESRFEPHYVPRAVVAEGETVGARRIRTMHRPSNLFVSRLYRGEGFVEVGRLEDGDVEPERRIEGGEGDG